MDVHRGFAAVIQLRNVPLDSLLCCALIHTALVSSDYIVNRLLTEVTTGDFCSR